MGHWVKLNRRERIKDFLTEKFNIIKNNKRGVVYAVATAGSGVVGYALTGYPVIGLACSEVSINLCMVHALKGLDNAYEKLIKKKN